MTGRLLELEEMEVTGIDFYCTDGTPREPTVTRLGTDDETLKWFTSHPSDPDAAIRILSLRIANRPVRAEQPRTRFFAEAVEHAFWGPEVYFDLLRHTRMGSCAALSSEPWRFMLQTPSDGYPWCSMALSKRGIVVKGVYIFDNQALEPAKILQGETINSGWRGSGLQIISLPQAVLKAHSMLCNQKIFEAASAVSEIETRVASTRDVNLTGSTHTLHHLGSEMYRLERRSRFDASIITSIEEVAAARAHHGTAPALAAAKSALEARKFDVETLPKRIQSARIAINDLILQRTQQQNLEIAESTRRIAEATMSDAASMKTIAVLTMVFLPGTAIASFFGMSMFDWSSNDGDGLASRWLWVYFVVAVPATAITLLVWWRWTRWTEKALKLQLSGNGTNGSNAHFLDAEAAVGGATLDSEDSVEMDDVRPPEKLTPC